MTVVKNFMILTKFGKNVKTMKKINSEENSRRKELNHPNSY